MCVCVCVHMCVGVGVVGGGRWWGVTSTLGRREWESIKKINEQE